MGRLFIALVLVAVCLGGADRKPEKKKKKESVVQVLQPKAWRTIETIALDGLVRNTGDRPIDGLVLIFDFITTTGSVISTQRMPADVERLDVGGETVYRAQMSDHARAVSYRISAEDGSGRDLRVVNAGPFVIE